MVIGAKTLIKTSSKGLLTFSFIFPKLKLGYLKLFSVCKFDIQTKKLTGLSKIQWCYHLTETRHLYL